MNKLVTTLLLATLIISMLAMASAAVTLVKPIASSYQSTTMIVNATLTAADCSACRNVTIWYNASGGAAQTLLTTITNDTADDLEFYSAAVSIAALSDGSTYNFSAKADNGTNQAWSAGNVLTIDNTDPTLTVKESTINQYEPINYKCSDTNIATFTVSHPNAAGTTVTFNLQKSTSDYVQYTSTSTGTYTFTCTDSAGNSATDTVTVSAPEGYAIPPTAQPVNQPKNNTMWWIVGVLVVIGVIWYYNKD